MRTVIGNIVFITKFGYPVDRDHQGNIIPIRRQSLCYIRVGKANDPEKKLSDRIITASATTSPKENFRKSSGRIVSFRRAMTKLFAEPFMSQYGLTKEDQTQFWNDLREQCPSTFVK